AGEDHTVRLWEAATGKDRGVFQGHQGPVAAVAFRPDGKALASGGEDHNALLWEVTAPGPGPAVPALTLTPGELEGLWQDLTGAPAAAGGRGAGGGGAPGGAPGKGRPLLKARFPAGPPRVLPADRPAPRRPGQQPLPGARAGHRRVGKALRFCRAAIAPTAAG